MIEGGCGDPNCSMSTGIMGDLTFGKGALDENGAHEEEPDLNGYWEYPCRPCEAAWLKKYPHLWHEDNFGT